MSATRVTGERDGNLQTDTVFNLPLYNYIEPDGTHNFRLAQQVPSGSERILSYYKPNIQPGVYLLTSQAETAAEIDSLVDARYNPADWKKAAATYGVPADSGGYLWIASRFLQVPSASGPVHD